MAQSVTRVVFVASCLAPAVSAKNAAFPNMNGEYLLQSTPTQKGSFPTNFSDYPGDIEYFEVYHGPIQHVYSEVFWTSMENDLPEDIKTRFANGKVMAIVGIEVDQVRRLKDNTTGELVDVSVPISFVYNHHHDVSIVGKGSTLEEVDRSDPRVGADGVKNYVRLDHGKAWLPVEHTPPTNEGMPTSIVFSDANGGEYRKSFHALAPPFAMLVESPESMGGSPMHIDTWNRDEMRLPDIADPTPPKFVSGPVPAHNLAPTTGPDAIYSGLLECPLTTRIQKIYDPGCADYNDTVSADISSPSCAHPVNTSTACFAAVAELPGLDGNTTTIATQTVDSDTLPAGCSVSVVQTGSDSAALKATATFNTHPANVTFTHVTGKLTAHGSDYSRGIEATFEEAIAACKADSKCKAITVPTSVDPPPAGQKLHIYLTSVTQVDQPVVTTHQSYIKTEEGVSCSSGSPGGISGSFQSSETPVEFALALNDTTATITISGPSDVWFGIGFDAALMSDLPYAITVAPPASDGASSSSSQVVERKLANHAAGTVLSPSVTLAADTVVGSRRTVVVTRALQGATKDHYSFTNTTLQLPFLHAVGSSPTFAIHKTSGASSLQLWPAGEDSFACVCAQPAEPFGQGSGFVKYVETGEQVGFPKGRCPPQPRGDLLAQRNPTCDLRAYVGGLSTCHHTWKLLDADQEIPWTDQPLVYYKKWRIYFQEYNATGGTGHHDGTTAGGPSHVNIFRHDWGIGADGDHAEYDVPAALPGTPRENRTHVITGTWVPVTTPDTYMVAVHMHCHAPTCLRVEMWNNDTGELLCAQEPVYGGTHVIDTPTYDEPGYIATPPCLWGNPADGLAEPPLMSNVNVKIVAHTNNTYGHHGEMALPQISLAHGPFTW